MKKIEQNDSHTHDDSHTGLSSDDLSMLNQVLQQVKGISCVSCAATYETIETTAAE